MHRTHTLLAAVLPLLGISAHPYLRRDDSSSTDPAIASMFAEGDLQALEHCDGSTNENLVIEKMLYTLNAVRYMHDALPVRWNQTLQDYATLHANKCNASHTWGPYGENLYIGGNNAGFAMNGDIEEKAWDDKGNPPATDGPSYLLAGHFFQLIWRDLTSFGCGRVYCGEDSNNGAGGPINSWMWFCEFDMHSGVEGFVGNVSKRTSDSVPSGWDVPENHVSFTSFPPIESPALSFPTTISWVTGVRAVTELGMTMATLPPDVIASETGVSGYGIVQTAGSNQAKGDASQPAPTASTAASAKGHRATVATTATSSPSKVKESKDVTTIATASPSANNKAVTTITKSMPSAYPSQPSAATFNSTSVSSNTTTPDSVPDLPASSPADEPSSVASSSVDNSLTSPAAESDAAPTDTSDAIPSAFTEASFTMPDWSELTAMPSDMPAFTGVPFWGAGGW